MVVVETGTLFVRKGWHKWGREDMERVLLFADVIIINFGLHYIMKDGDQVGAEYRDAMTDMMRQAQEFSETPGKVH